MVVNLHISLQTSSEDSNMQAFFKSPFRFFKSSECIWDFHLFLNNTLPSYAALQECCENDLSFHWKCTAKIVWKRSGTFNPCGDLYQCICKTLAHMYMCIFWEWKDTFIAHKFQCYIFFRFILHHLFWFWILIN